jgi:hypothetical protein
MCIVRIYNKKFKNSKLRGRLMYMIQSFTSATILSTGAPGLQRTAPLQRQSDGMKCSRYVPVFSQQNPAVKKLKSCLASRCLAY